MIETAQGQNEICQYFKEVICTKNECSTCSTYYHYKQAKDYEYKQRRLMKNGQYPKSNNKN